MGMPINALIDMLQMAMPYLEKIGDEQPDMEIRNPVELISLLWTVRYDIEDQAQNAVMGDHIRMFRDAMYMEVKP